jgi:predicted small lipoprotein YifL
MSLRSWRVLSWTLVLALSLLAGCGKKGALYLPEPKGQEPPTAPR